MTGDSADYQFRQGGAHSADRDGSLDNYRTGGTQSERLANQISLSQYTVKDGTLYFGAVAQEQERSGTDYSRPNYDQSSRSNQPQWFGKDGTIMEADYYGIRDSAETRTTDRSSRNRSTDSRTSGVERSGGNEKIIMAYFINKGLTPEQAAGIGGNIAHESPGSNPAQRQFGGGPGYGIAQWEGSRLRDLKQFAAAQGTPASDLGTQLDFMWKELNTTEKGSLSALKRARSATEAADIFQRKFERAGRPNLAARQTHADRILAQYAPGDGSSLG